MPRLPQRFETAMRQYGSLRRRSEFARVGRRGRRVVSQHLVLLTLDNPAGSRLGITVTKAIGNAVVRNRLRRRIKSVLDGRFGQAPYRDVLIIARAGAGDLSFSDLRAEIDGLV